MNNIKKLIPLLLLLFLLPYDAYAASGTALFNTNYGFTRKTTFDTTYTTVTGDYNLTDGSDTTYTQMGATGPAYYFFYTRLSSMIRVNGYKITPFSSNATTAANAKYELYFYNDSDTLITSITNLSSITNHNTDITPISGVRWIALRCIDNIYCRTSEFQIYTAPPDTSPPTVPTNFNVIPADGKLSLSWNPSTDNEGVAYYEIYKNGIYHSQTTGLTKDVTGVNGDDISVKVRAVDTSGNVSAFTSAIVKYPKDDVPPFQPLGIAVTVTDYQATLTWLKHTGYTDFRSYRLYRNSTLVHTTTPFDSDALSYTFTGLTNFTYYNLGVSAVDTSYNESNIAWVNAYIAGTPPPVPNLLTALAGNGKATLDWNPVTASDLDGYNVYVNGMKVNPTPLTATELEVNSLTNNVLYNFYVTSIDTAGNESIGSNTKSATPFAPLNVSVIPNGTDVAIVVTGGTGPYSYNIGSGFKTGASNNYAFVVGGLTPSTSYSITVTDDTGSIYTSTFDSGLYSGLLAPPVPDISDTVQSGINSFSGAGTVATYIVTGALLLAGIVILAIWAWRLLKKRYRAI